MKRLITFTALTLATMFVLTTVLACLADLFDESLEHMAISYLLIAYCLDYVDEVLRK